MKPISRFVVLTFLGLMLVLRGVVACGGGSGTAVTDDIAGDTSLNADWGNVADSQGPGPDVQGRDGTSDQASSEFTIPETGCGNGVCDPDEDTWSCAKDCHDAEWGALFVFAHKGDEWAALGRIHDLLAAGASVQVVYLTDDDTPFEQVYNGAKPTLAPVVLGVPVDNVFLYELNTEGWPLAAGPHAALDRLATQVKAFQPAEIYLPQLCGGDLDVELAHVVGLWAAKRSGMSPQPAFYEVPARSAYYLLEEPEPASAVTDPVGYVDLVLQRWKILPKDTQELKPTIGASELHAIVDASNYILDDWMLKTRDALPEDQYKHLLRMVQRYRLLPVGQDPEEPVYLSSIVNPEGAALYEAVGWTFDEFRHLVHVVQSFKGTNLLTTPLHIPGHQEPLDISIANSFDIELTIRNVSGEDDKVSIVVGIDATKDITDDCQLPPDTQISGWGEVQLTLHCTAWEEIGPHVFYIRAYSQQAEEAYEPAKFTEIPFVFNVFQ